MYIGKWSIHKNYFGKFFGYHKLSDGFLLDVFWITIIYSVTTRINSLDKKIK